MNTASSTMIHELRPKIIERRVRLQAAASSVSAEYVNDLLAEVDAALERIDNGAYGLCEKCHDTIEQDRLASNPLVRFCLDHLSGEELRAHEKDLELANQIQVKLLPARDIATREWETHYRYEPAGVVSGDYCEVVEGGGKPLFFAVGDVAGKGVAASLLMTHLSAIFRSLLSLDLPLTEVMSRANRLFCESTPAAHYATLVAGRATEKGVDLSNAGHCRPLLFRRDGTTDRIDATGLPLGLFCSGRYGIRHIPLEPGDRLVLYTDGITEAQDPEGNDYQEERLVRTLQGHAELDVTAMADGVLRDVACFRGARPQQDDITLLVVRRH
jgi:phosphoserine phosphatase RsbU/P